uniref:serine/arginine-rich splicing factor RSZ23-like n=1 Tax=Erigeron canadensis TaxID=72917 RepID=UPI001CB9BB8A|nr:serine/arginine-rich splicing factor RSZ23-like [Erigeron canadensis]
MWLMLGFQRKNSWRVKLVHNSNGDGGGGCGRGPRGCDDIKCYACGEPGHFVQACHSKVGTRGVGSSRCLSRSPRRCTSRSYRSDDDLTDDDSDYDCHGGYAASRKPSSASQVPLKKRLDPAECDVELGQTHMFDACFL